MGDLAYDFRFAPIQNVFRSVAVVDKRRRLSLELKLKVNDGPGILKAPGALPAVIADIIDLAVSIHVADRFSQPYRDERRKINIELPLRRSDLFCDPTIGDNLREILSWYTGDVWTFLFRRRDSDIRRLSEIHRPLPWREETESKEIALWSGGLDAFAGLCNRIRSNPDLRFYLFGVANSRETLGLQQKIAHSVRLNLRRRLPQLSQVAISIRDTEGFSGHKNKSPRTRGFAILLLGVAKAYLEGQMALHVYENGIGAINPSFPGGAHGIDHSRAVHPKSLCLVSEFVHSVLHVPFEIKNPFIFHTKGRMCQIFVNCKRGDAIASTVSCDRKPRTEKPRHCGWCSSCLLRKQALISARVCDATEYLADTTVPKAEFRTIRPHIFAMKAQVRHIEKCLSLSSPWKCLRALFPEVEDAALYLCDNELSAATVENNLVNLFADYVEEWRRVAPTLGYKVEDRL